MALPLISHSISVHTSVTPVSAVFLCLSQASTLQQDMLNIALGLMDAVLQVEFGQAELVAYIWQYAHCIEALQNYPSE